MVRRKVPPEVPAVLPLRVNDLLFITEYLRNGRNAVEAYRHVHPKAKYTSAAASACELLKKPKIQAEIANRMTHEGGITRELVESTLMQALGWAKAKEDADTVAKIIMDCAKLAGFLVEKHEDLTHKDVANREQVVQELKNRGLVALS